MMLTTDMNAAYLLIPEKKLTRKVPIRKTTFFVGRARENDLIIPSESLSRFHAQIQQRGEQFLITDRGSLNGVFVNGKRILGETLLNDGDIVGFGEVHARFSLEQLDVVKEKEKSSAHIQRYPVAKLVDSHQFVPEKRQKYLDLLYQFSARLLQQFPSTDLGQVILELVEDVWSPDRTCLMLRSSGEWQISSQRFGKNPRITGETLEISKSVIRELEDCEEALLIENVGEDQRFQASESMQRQNVSSVMCAPLWNNKKIHGFLYADLIFSPRGFQFGDLEMFAILANLMAMKWENDQLWHQALIQQQLEQELNLAAEIQRKFFPTQSPAFPGYEVGAITIPTRKVGGDSYFWHERSDGALTLMIADVMGKGLPSALLMSQIQALMKIFSERGDAAEIVTAVNDFIYRYSTQEKFISMVVMVLNPDGNLSFCNAGHNPPFVLQKDGGHRLLIDGGMPVGVFLDQKYAKGVEILQPGEIIVLYTDGITEARDKNDEEFGMDRLFDATKKNSELTAQALAPELVHTVREEWLATDQEDDWTLLVVKRN